MNNEKCINLDQLLDEQTLGKVPILVVGLCLLAMIIDGYDMFMIGLALPMIAADFGVQPSAVTSVMVAQNIGLALGTYLAGPISDRFGRKPILILCVVCFGLLTLLTAQVTSLTQFTVIRFITGIFFAGVIPTAVSLTNEMTPKKYRSGFVA